MLIQENVPLAPLTTLQVGGPGRYFIQANTIAEVSEAVSLARSRNLKLFVLGGGSNLVVSDAGWPGLVLQIAIPGIEERSQDDKSLFEVGLAPFARSLAIHGMISLERGFIFSSMILASIGVALIEREFVKASAWSLAAASFSAVGIIHAYDLAPGGVTSRFGLFAAPEFAIGYLLLAVLFWAVSRIERNRDLE